jgi:membrane fusion protein (multidrug efflux system)
MMLWRLVSAFATALRRSARRPRSGTLRLQAFTVACTLGVAACSKPPPPAQQTLAVQVAEVVQQDVPVSSEWVGTTDGYINAQIRAKVQGYLLTRAYREGSTVKAGQLLYQLDPRQYQADLDKARGDLAQAKANLMRSQLNEQKYRPLVAAGAVSRREYDDTVQEVRANQAAVEAAQASVEAAKLNLEWTRITSPIDGVVGITQAQIGDLISPATIMTTVSQVDPIKVYLPISEQEYLKFADGIEYFMRTGDDSRAPTLELILANGDVFPHHGKPSAVNRQVEVQTGAIQIEALFDNPENLLRPGQFARIRAVTETLKGALVVPQRAVQEVQGSHQVAIVGPDDTVQIRGVTVGPRYENLWVISDGVKPGERVVAEGLQKVRDGAKVQPKPYVEESTVKPTAPVAATPG